MPPNHDKSCRDIMLPCGSRRTVEGRSAAKRPVHGTATSRPAPPHHVSAGRSLGRLVLALVALFGTLLPKLLNVVVDAFRKAQLTIHVARLRVVGVRADWEV